MRVIVLGNKITVQRLTASLVGRDNEMVNLSEVYEVITLMTQENFDLVVVDGSGKKIGMICRHVREFDGVPIVLMVGQKQPNWEELQSLGIDGCIPQTANGAELAARLQAVIRRCLHGTYVRTPVQKRNMNQLERATIDAEYQCYFNTNFMRN